MQPNRLQSCWPFITRKLRETYPRVAIDLWDGTGGRHDQIVHLVKATYAPGRASIQVEAEVRDLLNRWVDEIEQVQ